MFKSGLKDRRRLGYFVFGTLVAAKAAEYVMATTIPQGAWPVLAVLALIGAWLILYYFMHIGHLWRPESKGDE